MRRQPRAIASVVVPLLVGLALGGLALFRGRVTQSQGVLPVYGQVPAFSLVDQHGQPVSRQTLHGSVWVADFIFTRCAGQCPFLSAQMAQLAAALPRTTAVKFVSFTVDPVWDTPEVLARYAASYETSGTAWSFVTGEEAAIRRLCREGFRLGVSAQGTDEEPITHSTRLVLVDRDGRIRGYYDVTEEASIRQLQDDLRRLF